MIVSLILSLAMFFAPLQQPSQPQPQDSQSRQGAAPRPDRPPEKPPVVEQPPVVTRHEIRAGSRVLKYTATTGMMPLKNQAGDIARTHHRTRW